MSSRTGGSDAGEECRSVRASRSSRWPAERACATEGTPTTIAGEVVDLWCHLEGGDRGPAKRECAIACAKAGNPIGVIDAKGNVYIAADLKDHEPAQTLLLQKMSSQVTVTGTLVKAGGVQMIYIESLK